MISAILICIDYDDFFSFSAPTLVKAFDRVIVITEENQESVIHICRQHGFETVFSRQKNYRGLKFNLPALLNDGIRQKKLNDWICKIDSDIYFPDGMKDVLKNEVKDIHSIYYTNRYFCETPEILRTYERTNDFSVLEPPYEETTDVLGFVQLFNLNSIYLKNVEFPYEQEFYAPPSFTNDRIFSQQWPVHLRTMLSKNVIHLGLEAIGTNWFGRKSQKFTLT